MTSTGFLTPESELHRSKDAVMQNAGFPKPGDIPTLNRKILKAQRVVIREHPYVASVRRQCAHYVTGVLTTRNVVLTVAHPVYKFNTGPNEHEEQSYDSEDTVVGHVPVRELGVVLGENYSDRGSMIYTVVLVIVHHDFDPFSLRNDIAMLRVYEHITYKMNVKSIVLMAPSAILTGKIAFVTGWGRCDNMGTELCLDRTSRYYPNEKMDPMLRTASFIVPEVSHYCDEYKRHDVSIRAGMLCTGVARAEDRVAPCLAVPGAPLVVRARLVGLLSWGFGCGYSFDLPLVYSDIRHYVPWIAHNNKVMYHLKQNNFTVLFEATKAAVLSQWIIETRRIKPNFTIRTDKSVEPLAIDYDLIHLKGKIYDERDFISEGRYSKDKTDMYLRVAEKRVRKVTGVWWNRQEEKNDPCHAIP